MWKVHPIIEQNNEAPSSSPGTDYYNSIRGLPPAPGVFRFPVIPPMTISSDVARVINSLGPGRFLDRSEIVLPAGDTPS